MVMAFIGLRLLTHKRLSTFKIRNILQEMGAKLELFCSVPVTNGLIYCTRWLKLMGVVSMADQKHEHGSMDVSVQEKGFSSFISIVSRSSIAIIVALVLLYLING